MLSVAMRGVWPSLLGVLIGLLIRRGLYPSPALGPLLFGPLDLFTAFAVGAGGSSWIVTLCATHLRQRLERERLSPMALRPRPRVVHLRRTADGLDDPDPSQAFICESCGRPAALALVLDRAPGEPELCQECWARRT